jgi:hypothetical protein
MRINNITEDLHITKIKIKTLIIIKMILSLTFKLSLERKMIIKINLKIKINSVDQFKLKVQDSLIMKNSNIQH